LLLFSYEAYSFWLISMQEDDLTIGKWGNVAYELSLCACWHVYRGRGRGRSRGS